MKAVTFQAKTGARDSGKRNNNEPVTPYKAAHVYVRKRDVLDNISSLL